ncbi:PIG-L family deacetylase [Robiginitalea aurantiaca]|uniref:PIG-L family deacetylase n=1 Tax=Robiginitalea aurantiaca TaxID=3056915 RepID=A0ABT7WGZ0_9FLAO|nr:PIG-L family deacetylase [Robiginitalea aurantiaca]MDM9632187.1 PIG-L family deacetylase [Robiginitalea aurantiaca]
MRYILGWLLIGTLLLPNVFNGQGSTPPSSVKLYNDLRKLNFLGSALYIAAHPDDENTRLISYLSNHVHARTAYLSLTRGDGGQNLIGTELRELLGVLRTQELLAARGVDGGQQFFTRANDFGYSKHPDETLRIWDRDAVLSDVVRVIRTFRPDVIVNRFDHRTPGSTHGHHTSSAILSTEAFELAGNRGAYPEQLNGLEPWSPDRLFYNASWWSYGSRENFEKADKSRLVPIDVGVYYPERGLSNNEIAATASSQHRCQGFGRPNVRGSEMEYVELLKGSMPGNGDLFDGIDTSWGRLAGGEAIGAILDPMETSFNFENPSSHLPQLLEAYKILGSLADSQWKRIKQQELLELIVNVSGLYIEASSREYSANPGETAAVRLEFVNRSEWPVEVQSFNLDAGTKGDSLIKLPYNQRIFVEAAIAVPVDHEGTDPYWLREAGTQGLYSVKDPNLIGKPRTPPAFFLRANLNINGTPLTYVTPVIHRYSESDKGELVRAFEVLPKVTASFEEQVSMFTTAHSRPVKMVVKSHTQNAKGTVSLKVPQGWQAEPESYSFELDGKGDEKVFQFTLLPPPGDSQGFVNPEIKVDGLVYNKELISIVYEHIPAQTVLLPASVKVVRLNVEKAGQHIGYVMGAGDQVPENLEAIGYTIHPLGLDALSKETLKKMDAVVLGIRAYNVLDELPFKNDILLNYVKEGGTLIVQYNTSGRGPRDFSNLAPFPLRLSRDRVSDETAKVEILEPEHPILNFPNRIDERDFEGWVQERGLYFPDTWDDSYTALLSMNDPGETPKQGGLLVAPYGSGYYIYTGLSFFRELPAGVPGAFKLLSNMLSIGKAPIPIQDGVKG